MKSLRSVLAITVLFAMAGWSQEATGIIAGNVTDPAGKP